MNNTIVFIITKRDVKSLHTAFISLLKNYKGEQADVLVYCIGMKEPPESLINTWLINNDSNKVPLNLSFHKSADYTLTGRRKVIQLQPDCVFLENIAGYFETAAKTLFLIISKITKGFNRKDLIKEYWRCTSPYLAPFKIIA